MPGITLITPVETAGPAVAIALTDEQVASLGGGKTPPVCVTVDGQTVRVRVFRMGGSPCIGFRKELRDQLGLEPGREITARIELDAAERTVDLPDELAEALAAAGLREAFDAWSYTRRKEAANGVRDAKRSETRERRVAAVIATLRG